MLDKLDLIFEIGLWFLIIKFSCSEFLLAGLELTSEIQISYHLTIFLVALMITKLLAIHEDITKT